MKNKGIFINSTETGGSISREVNLSSRSYQYVSSSQKTHQLEHNHSHFLLFDPGNSETQKDSEVYRTRVFRFHFEAYMKEYGRKGKGVPVVNFLISGKLTGKNEYLLNKKSFRVPAVGGNSQMPQEKICLS